MKRLILSMALVAGLWNPAWGQQDFNSGNHMLQHCEHFITTDYRYDVWDGECGGVVSALMFFGEALPKDYRFCAPKGVTQSQAGRIVINYMRSRPDLLHLNFRGLAATALHLAWPCR